jgi:fatty-acyl-CoA synthase
VPQQDLGYNLIHRFNAGDALHRSAARYPHQRAVHCMGRDLTYTELDQLANRVARLLLESGIDRGDSVAILSLNSPEFIAAFFGCARIGAPLVPINLLLSPDDIDDVLARTNAKALFVDPYLETKLNRSGAVVSAIPHQFTLNAALRENLASIDGSLVERYVENEDAATIIFTSGTTAKPKGVVSTHLNWYATLISAYLDGGVTRKDVPLIALPLFHIAGLYTAWMAFAAGVETVLVPAIRPDMILDAIAKHRITTTSLPATAWVGLLQVPGIEKVDFTNFERLAVFQYLPTPAFARWRKLVPHAKWSIYWGQTETSPLGSNTPPEDLERKLIAPDPIGTPHLPLEVRVVDDAMNEVGENVVGEFVCRGPSVTPGYLNDPAANAALFAGGWHHTGDMGYRDDEGCLYFVDRKKDMIKSGGENVSSQEVEEAISKHPAVSEVAVFGLPDPYWIESVTAAVTLRTGAHATEEELLLHAKANLANFKAPKQLFILSELPKNPTGKVLKRELRKQLEMQQAQ